MPKDKYGQCPFCNRECDLTFHHLIPKKMHRRTYFKKNFDKETLNQGIDICRQCHSGIHSRYDEMALAKTRNTVAQLQNDAELQKHFRWVAKQKVRKKSA